MVLLSGTHIHDGVIARRPAMLFLGELRELWVVRVSLEYVADRCIVLGPGHDRLPPAARVISTAQKLHAGQSGWWLWWTCKEISVRTGHYTGY